MENDGYQQSIREPICPTFQGLLVPDMLPSVLELGMKDDIYSLWQILQPNLKTGALSKIAVLTENGALMITSASCRSLIAKAIRQGSQTHVADQVDGIYVLRQKLNHIEQLTWRSLYGVHAARSLLTADGPWTQRPYMSRTVHSDGLICEDLVHVHVHRLHVHLHATTQLVTTSH